MTDTTARVWHITRITRDYVYMQMKYRLARRGSRIKTDVVSVRMVQCLYAVFRRINGSEKISLFLGRCVKPGRYVPSCDQQSVPW